MSRNAKYQSFAAAFAIFITLFASHGLARAGQTATPNDSIVAIASVSVEGSLFKATTRALHRSRDGGRTWRPIPLPQIFGDGGQVTSLAASAGAKGVLYLAGLGQGVFRTTDNGKSWEPSTSGLPNRNVTALASHAELPGTLYAVLAEMNIYRSQDAGNSWELMDEGPERIGQLIHTNMKGSMQTGWLFAATSQGIHRTMDCFCLWRRAGNLEGEIRSLAYDPRKPEHVYAVSNGKLFRSRDGGEAWEQPIAPSVNLAALAFTQSGALYAVTSDGKLFRSEDGAATWERVDA